MKRVTKKEQLIRNCKVLIQYCLICSLFSSLLLAQDNTSGNLSSLSIWGIHQEFDGVRRPSHFVPDDEVVVTPEIYEVWLQEIFIEDDKGVLRSVTNDIKTWENEEQFVKDWSLESTTIYTKTPTLDKKKSYLLKQSLKYFDKRLSGEIKRAKKGSTMASIGHAREALRPTTKVSFTDNIKIKMQARVLQGKVYVRLENPYLDQSVAEVNLRGEVLVKAGKHFKALGLGSNVEYNVNDGVWVAELSKGIIKGVSAVVSSRQSVTGSPLSDDSEQEVGLYYHLSF